MHIAAGAFTPRLAGAGAPGPLTGVGVRAIDKPEIICSQWF